jgi:hypothetical protein
MRAQAMVMKTEGGVLRRVAEERTKVLKAKRSAPQRRCQCGSGPSAFTASRKMMFGVV